MIFAKYSKQFHIIINNLLYDASYTSYIKFKHKVVAALRFHTFTTLHNADEILANDSSYFYQSKQIRRKYMKTLNASHRSQAAEETFQTGACSTQPAHTHWMYLPISIIHFELGHFRSFSNKKREFERENVYAFTKFNKTI